MSYDVCTYKKKNKTKGFSFQCAFLKIRFHYRKFGWSGSAVVWKRAKLHYHKCAYESKKKKSFLVYWSVKHQHVCEINIFFIHVLCEEGLFYNNLILILILSFITLRNLWQNFEEITWIKLAFLYPFLFCKTLHCWRYFVFIFIYDNNLLIYFVF